MKKLTISAVGLLLIIQPLFGQFIPQRPLTRSPEDNLQEWKRLKQSLATQKELEKEKKRTIEEINGKLSVPDEYKKNFTKFLKRKNAGIARILPDKDCNKGLVATVQELERCANEPQIKGAGSLFSARLNEIPSSLMLDSILSYMGQSDIRYTGEKFIVGNELTMDIISEIGEVNFDEIKSKSDVFKFLRGLKPSKTKRDLGLQKEVLEKGVNSNGYSYSTVADVKLNHSYALRSIAHWEKYHTFWNTDILMAFKVVGRESDGSVLIIWKVLEEELAPRLKE